MAETLAKRFAELENAKQIRPQISRPKIQRVANYLRNRKHFAKHYSPKLVSMGPIHHGDPTLRLGEQHKLMWAAKYIASTRRTPQSLHKRIEDKIEELKGLFTSALFNDFFTFTPSESFASPEEKLSWVLFVDGCALLQILEKAKLDNPDKMNVKIDRLVLVMQDVLLLENQLPYQVLKLLWRNNNESALIETMKNFLRCHHWATANSDQMHQGMEEDNNIEEDEESTVVDVSLDEPPIHQQSRVVDISQGESPAHLLDLQRTIILPPKEHSNLSHNGSIRMGLFHTFHNQINRKLRICFNPQKQDEKDSNKNSSDMITYRNIKELRAAGISLKSSKTRRPRDVSFSHGWLAGELTLPEIVVDDTTAATFLNLIAYEMCPDFENDYGICSFAAFMDSLIDHPDDVKELRSQGILLNSLGSDEEVARLFNTISTDLVPDTVAYSGVRAQIDRHYKNKCKTWIALGFHTYFDNPWAIIAFHAAVIALALTFVQTWFAIYPAK